MDLRGNTQYGEQEEEGFHGVYESDEGQVMPCEFYLGPGNWALRDHEAVIGNNELKPLFKAAAKANETVTFILTELADGLKVRGRIRDHRLP